MSNDNMREEFEAWASSPEFGLRAGHFVKGDDGEYVNYPTQCYWQVWQASRESLVIDLPKVIGSLMYSSDVYEAVEAAGLKVEP